MSVRTIAALSTTAIALVAAPVLSAQASGHQATTSHQATARTAHVRVVDYPGDGVTVRSARDVRKLRATSTRFQDFVVREMGRQRTEVQPGCRVEVTVDHYRADGFADGSLWAKGCGGAAAVWATKQGVWGEIWSGQYQPTCKELSRAAGRTVPKGLADCH